MNYHIIVYMDILARLKNKAVKFTFWVCLGGFATVLFLGGRGAHNSENFLLIAALCLIEMKLQKN